MCAIFRQSFRFIMTTAKQDLGFNFQTSLEQMYLMKLRMIHVRLNYAPNLRSN